MLKNYIKTALKVLLRRKFFTFISLFGISFTLIVLMVITAMVDYLVAPMAPDTKADRILGIYFSQMTGPEAQSTSPAGYKLLDKYARNLPHVESFSICTMMQQVNGFPNGDKVQAFLKRTDGNYWRIFDFQFLEGGPFLDEDNQNANFVAVINEATRQKFFGNTTAVGKTMELDGQRFRVVGVVTNVPITRLIPFSDVWVPLTTAKSDSYRNELMGGHTGVILAENAAAIPLIKAEFDTRIQAVEIPNPKQYTEFLSRAETLWEFVARTLTGDYSSRATMKLLMAAMSFMFLFMLLPAINLINITVSRILERSSEIGVRKAFGASSMTLIGQFVVENVILTLVGGMLGLVGSWLVLRGISESGLIPYAQYQINWRIFLYGLGLALVFGVVSGVYPAWKMSRLHPVEALKGGVR
ncbi:MAG: ABC transporter permease [Acidobacteria bacterium]|nr:ABC transporter permease [Acidobacteriota bacterium]